MSDGDITGRSSACNDAWMVKANRREAICREVSYSRGETFRDYNRVRASVRDSPIHLARGSKDIGGFLTSEGFGEIIIFTISVAMASSRGNSSSMSVY